MSDQQKSLSGFIQELRNRRVFRVLATYAVIAFVIIQIADIVFPALHGGTIITICLKAHNKTSRVCDEWNFGRRQ